MTIEYKSAGSNLSLGAGKRRAMEFVSAAGAAFACSPVVDNMQLLQQRASVMQDPEVVVTNDNNSAFFGSHLFGVDTFESWDASDPTNMVLQDSVSGVEFEGARGLAFRGGFVFLASGQGGVQGLVSIDVTDPTSISLADTITTNFSDVRGVGINEAGDVAIVADRTEQVAAAIDISDPNNLTELDRITTNNAFPTSAAVGGGHAYIGGFDSNGLMDVIDISVPTNLTIVDVFDWTVEKGVASSEPRRTTAPDLNQDIAFFHDVEDSTLNTVDISDPLNLSILDSVSRAPWNSSEVDLVADFDLEAVYFSTNFNAPGPDSVSYTDPTNLTIEDTNLLGDTGWGLGIDRNSNVKFRAGSNEDYIASFC